MVPYKGQTVVNCLRYANIIRCIRSKQFNLSWFDQLKGTSERERERVLDSASGDTCQVPIFFEKQNSHNVILSGNRGKDRIKKNFVTYTAQRLPHSQRVVYQVSL